MKHNGKYVKIAIGASLALALIIVGVALAAPVAIDTFNDGFQDLEADQVVPTVEESVTGTMVGGERDAQVNWLSGDFETVVLKIDRLNSNRLVFSLGGGVKGNALMQWDGSDGSMALNATGLNSSDLTDGGQNDCFVLRVLANDSPVAVTLRVYQDGTNWSRYTIDTPGNIPNGSVVDLVIPFNSFTIVGGTGADFAHVGAVEMFVDGTLQDSSDVILDFFEARAVRDYGDLPGGYPVSLAEDGARHIPQGLRLGARVDTEANGVHSTLANQDDTTDAADEDGVVRPAINWTPGVNGGHLDITVAGCPVSCFLNGWINWDTIGASLDTDFDDVGEHVFIDRAIVNGTTHLVFDVPVDPSNNTFDARFRLCSTIETCDAVTGEVVDGEVEDYRWSFGPTAISLVSVTANSRSYNSTNLLLGIGVLLVIGAASIFTLAKRRKL
jgi:hypothetical protein